MENRKDLLAWSGIPMIHPAPMKNASLLTTSFLMLLTLTLSPGTASAARIGSVPASLDEAKRLATLVLVVDKGWDGRTLAARQAANPGSTLQTMRVFVRGVLQYTFPVTTGAETWMKPPYSGAYFASTPVGVFMPDWMTPSVVSTSWGVEMPNAVMLTGDGIALHAALAYKEVYLGQRQSGGCVRLQRANSQIVYNLIQQYAGGCYRSANYGAYGQTCSFENIAVVIYDSNSQPLR